MIWIVFLTVIKNRIWKLIITITNIFYFLYSGLGIITLSLDIKYILAFLISLFAMNIAIYIGWKFVFFLQKTKDNSGTNIDTIIYRNKHWVRILFYLYLIVIVVFTIYPENKLIYIFKIPNFNIDDALDLNVESLNNTITQIFNLLKMFLYPFALVYIYITGKKRNLYFFLFFDFYIKYIGNYAILGRRSIIELIIFILLIKFLEIKSTKQIIKLGVISILSLVVIVFLYSSIGVIRSGGQFNFNDYNYINSLLELIKSEFSYPKHYKLAEELYLIKAYNPATFFYWLFTLPIPKVLISLPNYDSVRMIIYRVFSYHYFGIWWGEGAGGVLPSMLGEGIMLYGLYLSFIHLFICGLFIGFFTSFLQRNRVFTYYMVTVLIYYPASFRAGSQYLFTRLNYFVAIVLILLVLKSIPIKKKSINNQLLYYK